MIPVRNAEIRRYDSQYDALQETIPQGDIVEVSLTERTGKRIDDGSITLNNDDGTYDTDPQSITSGNVLEFRVEFGADYLQPWGEGSWGDDRWGDMRTIWTARVRDRKYQYRGQKCDLVLDCEDWMFSKLSDLNVTREFENVPIYKAFDRVIALKSNHIDHFVSQDISGEINIKFDGESVFSALEELMDQSGAEARAWKNNIIVKPDFDDSPQFTVQGDDMHIEEVLESDQELATFVKLHGGTAVTRGANYISQAFYYDPITSGEQKIFQIQTEKSELAQLDLRLSSTKKPTDSAIKVRLQKDDDGEPLAPDDSTKDIVSAQIGPDDIMKHYRGDEGYEGWITINFPNHTLPEPNPWAIIEVQGDGVQRFVYDLDLEPNHIPYFPYKIVSTASDFASQVEHGRREKRIEAEHVTSDREADSLANRKLNKYNQLDRVVKGRVKTWRMHNLRPGDRVTLDYPNKNVSGDYILRERDATFENTKLDTKVTLENDS